LIWIIAFKWVRYEDGAILTENCYDVLNKILQPFNVILRQSDAKIWIRQKFEHNSYVYAYQNDGTYVSRTASNLIKNIDNYKFVPGANQLNKTRPYDEASIEFKNRRIISNLVANSDFSSGTTNWNNGTSPADWSHFSILSGHLQCAENTGTGDPGDEKYFESDSFSVSYNSSGDKLKVEVTALLNDITFNSGGQNPDIEIALVRPGGTVTRGCSWTLDTAKKIYQCEFSITSTGSHKVRVYNAEASGTDIDDYEVNYYLIEAFAIYENTDFTFDKKLVLTNSSPKAKKSHELNVYFGDSSQSDDVGAFKIGSSMTEFWNSYGGSEGLNIIELLGKQLLQDRSAWKDVRLLKILDLSNNIMPHHVLQMGTKEFDFVNYDKDIVNNTIKCQLIEVIQNSITYTALWVALTTIDGKDS